MIQPNFPRNFCIALAYLQGASGVKLARQYRLHPSRIYSIAQATTNKFGCSVSRSTDNVNRFCTLLGKIARRRAFEAVRPECVNGEEEVWYQNFILLSRIDSTHKQYVRAVLAGLVCGV